MQGQYAVAKVTPLRPRLHDTIDAYDSSSWHKSVTQLEYNSCI